MPARTGKACVVLCPGIAGGNHTTKSLLGPSLASRGGSTLWELVRIFTGASPDQRIRQRLKHGRRPGWPLGGKRRGRGPGPSDASPLAFLGRPLLRIGPRPAPRTVLRADWWRGSRENGLLLSLCVKTKAEALAGRPDEPSQQEHNWRVGKRETGTTLLRVSGRP